MVPSYCFAITQNIEHCRARICDCGQIPRINLAERASGMCVAQLRQSAGQRLLLSRFLEGA